MILLPAIDIVRGKAVRLFRGDYDQMTIYSEHPEEVAADFKAAGAKWIHLVDLEGAKSGTTPNIETVSRIVKTSGLQAEIGGGIRSMETVEKYLDAGVSRVILGTAAVNDPGFLSDALGCFGERIAVGVDLKDGYVAVKGWTEKSRYTGIEFLKRMEDMGVRTVIVTDISKDGAMQGTNLELYRELQEELSMNVIASGGVSSMADVLALKETGLYGAIIGKAYYTGAIDLRAAVSAANKEISAAQKVLPEADEADEETTIREEQGEKS